MARKKIYNWQSVIYILIILSITAIIGLAQRYHQSFSDNLTENYNRQLYNSVHTASLNMENYIEKFSENLICTSHNPYIIDRLRYNTPLHDSAIYCPMHNLFKVHQDEINAIILVDTNGMVVKRIPESKKMKGTKCMSFPHPAEMNQEDSIYYSEIFINHGGFPSITFSVPIFDQGEKLGIIRWMVSLKTIEKNFITPINDDGSSHLILTNEEYNIISTRKNYIDWYRDKLHKEFHSDIIKSEELTADLESKHSGVGRYTMADGEQILAAFNSVKFGDQHWHLIICLAAGEIDEPLQNQALVTWSIAAAFSLLVLSISILFFSTRRQKYKLEKEALYLSKIAQSEELLRVEREKRLSALIEGQEKERKRISRDLHDGLGQVLLTLKMKIDDLRGNDENLGTVKELFDQTIEEVKRISNDLTPIMLDEIGIENALEKYCLEAARISKINIDFVSFNLNKEPASTLKTHIFRICQEAVTNSLRHSGANDINVQLLGNPKQINLIIQDNGAGFDPGKKIEHSGNGLNNIQERCKMINAEYSLETREGEGTTIRIKIPLSNEQ